MFERYRFYHPDNKSSVGIGGFSYFCAGLFGALYFVLKARGGPRLLAAIGLNLLCLLAVVGVLFATSLAAGSATGRGNRGGGGGHGLPVGEDGEPGQEQLSPSPLADAAGRLGPRQQPFLRAAVQACMRARCL